MVKPPSLPVYDPAKDGNPFVWIIQAAEKVRQAREPIQRLGISNDKKSPKRQIQK
ncbi:MAG TPA: hypothetical protein PLU16_14770 [Gallionellaceae bacterium]|jgi:hypothetical protein|nr:hypothetical protein [Gallionellaceae bacterium]HQS76467.1 hypothetical protein [Gallionellaceae bacterium]